MVRRRRGEAPFERRRTFTPWAIRRTNRARERLVDAKEEDQQTKGKDIRAEGRNLVPASECLGIVDIVAWHAGQTREMHREEQHIGADKGHPEMQLANPLRNDAAIHFREPIIPSREDREHCAKR